MAGIAGYIKYNAGEALDNLLDGMSRSLRYRENACVDRFCNDIYGICRIHHGVVNPEPQPIFNEDESICIAMDGEVFDYEEQKAELIHKGHKFRFENNDAEYCLHLYEEKGEYAFKELNGSFCIAIYHLANHELLLITDRLSSYPIFYYVIGKGAFLFSTQVSSILGSPEVARELNIEAMLEFFTFERVLGTKTLCKNVNWVPPATIMRYRDGSISFATYWELRYKEERHTKSYYVDKLAMTIKKSVERRTQGNYNFGILLSGGLDSRTVLAASDRKMIAFTFGDFENREVRIAKRVAEVKGCEHVFLKRSPDHYANLVHESVDIGNGMYPFPNAHAIGFFDQIKRQCDILLHGFAPELFFRGTNLPHRELKLRGRKLFSILDKLSNENLSYNVIEKLEYSRYQDRPHQLFTKHYSSILDSILLESVTKILNEIENNCENVYDRFAWFDTNYYSRFTSFLNESSLRPFITERSIVIDNDLLELHLKMPLGMRSNSKIWKKALVKLDPEIANIPDTNRGLMERGIGLIQRTICKITGLKLKSVYLPSPTYTHESWPNYAELIRQNAKLRETIANTIGDPKCLDPTIFDIRQIEEMFVQHLDGMADYKWFLFLLLTFGIWHGKYVP